MKDSDNYKTQFYHPAFDKCEERVTLGKQRCLNDKKNFKWLVPWRYGDNTKKYPSRHLLGKHEFPCLDIYL